MSPPPAALAATHFPLNTSHQTRPAIPLATSLVLASLCLSLLVSGNLLDRLGLAYSTEGGAIFCKIHPASYLLYACLAATLLTRPQLGSLLRAGGAAGQDAAWFCAAMAFCTVATLLANGSGAVVILADSFLPAGIDALVLAATPARNLAPFASSLRSLALLNALLAMAEMALHIHLIPSPDADFDARAEFRAMALYDHPLTGSAVTMLAMLLPLPNKPRWQQAGYILCLTLGMLSFGGRVALMLALLGLLWQARAALRGHTLLLAASITATALLLVAAYALFGLGSRIVDNFYWDNSAQVRIDQFAVLSRLTPADFLFGCERAQMFGLIESLRLQYNVGVLEDFWLLMLVLLGIPCFLVFCAGMTALARWCWRLGKTPGRIMLASFLVVTSASNSLGRKSILLPILIVSVRLAGLTPHPAPRRAA